MNYAEKMRRTRLSPQYCYMQYNDIRQKKPQAFIAFFEGYDAPYYLPIIENTTRNEAEQVICGNKKNVIAVHDCLLAKKIVKKSNTGFFIDRDYDDNSTIENRKDYFITKGYSVENYYCQTSAFERMLKSYMHYNCAHPDYDSIVANYKDLQKQYNDACLEFNAWYCSIKRNGINVGWSLDEKMPTGYVNMDIGQFKIEKAYTMTQIHNDYKANPQPSKDDVKKWAERINKDAVYNMRGKYEFTFLISYLSSLDKMVNDPSTAFEGHAMKFNMGQKDALSALAQYAERDCDLEDYIKRRSA